MQNQFRMIFALVSLLLVNPAWAQSSWSCQQECSPKSPVIYSAEQAPGVVEEQKACIDQCQDRTRQEEVESMEDEEINNLDRLEEEE